jgi:hypothetical protein
MPLTEIVSPEFKLDPESLAALQEAEPRLFSSVKDIPGLWNFLRGPILEENGQDVDPAKLRSVLALGKAQNTILSFDPSVVDNAANIAGIM